MAKEIVIGKTEKGKPLVIDLPKLIDSRLLIQATSGGGKSYAIRKLLEETHGKVQQIVLDPEGEFATLREKYDYVLIGKEGDIQPEVRSASLLAKKLLENNVSAIIDLYELKKHERVRFVKDFLDAMINAPKLLWHPCLVILDEAHDYCSEKVRVESSGAVIDLTTRGRKRGFCCVLATQRLAKLNKDAAAECNNKLMGRTTLDVDMKRAADELGFTKKTEMLALRNLEDGEFFAFGKAISQTVIKVKIGKVKTAHPQSGMRAIAIPKPATEKLKKVLSKLADLPQKAEEELREKQDYINKIRELKFELRKQKGGVIDKKALERAKQGGVIETEHHYKMTKRKLEKQVNDLTNRLAQIAKMASKRTGIIIPPGVFERPTPLPQPKPQPVTIEVEPPKENGMNMGITKLRAGAMRMLKAIAMFYPQPVTKFQVATLSGFSVKGGTFTAYLSELKKAEWIKEQGGKVTITEEGLDQAGDVPELPTDPTELVNLWAGKFRRGAANMLKIIAERYPEGLTKEELGMETNFEPTGGTFNAYLSELRRNHLIEIREDGLITATKTLFLED